MLNLWKNWIKAVSTRSSFLIVGVVLVCVILIVENSTNTSQQINWHTWLMGQSVSFEFHFLDLLELLSRFGSNQ